MAAVSSAGRGPTLAERETLMVDYRPHHSGFHPRSVQRLATTRLPRTMVNIECNHFLRTSTDEAAHGHPQVSYRLWLEAGKHPLPVNEKPDTEYNSNMWRNFRKSYGFHPNSDGQKINEMIASMYPLSIPPPSRVGSYTYARFLAETPLIKDPVQRKVAIQRTKEELRDFKELGLVSEMKNPPLDTIGNILPPRNFKRYESRLLPPPDEPVPAAPAPPAYPTRTDMFGKQVPLPKRGPHLWKLSHKIHNPQFHQMEERLRSQRADPTRQPAPPSALTQRQSHLSQKGHDLG